MTISKRLRFEILRRDNHACRYCGRTAAEGPLTVDHVIPETLGGSDLPSNLVAACVDCNSGKSSIPPGAAMIEDVSADAIRWARAMAKVAEIRQQEIADRREVFSWFNSIWCNWTDRNNQPLPTPTDGFDSILHFLNAGLTRDEIATLVDVAMRARKVRHDDIWRYFCGCCWNRIRQNIDMASAIIEAEDNG